MTFGTFLNFFLALVVVLGLIGVLSWAGRRFGMEMPFLSRHKGGPRRISVIESTSVDGKHRLVLVKRDQVEHLLMLDPTGAVVVESNIVKGQPGEKAEKAERRPKAAEKQQAEAASWLER
jgi:flagellar protein FliO/FliZ